MYQKYIIASSLLRTGVISMNKAEVNKQDRLIKAGVYNESKRQTMRP